MQAERIVTKPSVRIVLTAEEAEWLQAFLQNPSVHDEAEIDRQMRERFFKELDTVNNGYF